MPGRPDRPLAMVEQVLATPLARSSACGPERILILESAARLSATTDSSRSVGRYRASLEGARPTRGITRSRRTVQVSGVRQMTGAQRIGRR